jgi:hypothetical protein
MSRGGTVMDYGGLSELNLEDSNGHPIRTNPSRSRVSSRPLSRFHPNESGEEDPDIVHVGRPISLGRHSSETSPSLEMNRVDNQDILPHTTHEFGLPSRSHRRHDSRNPSDYRRSRTYSSRPADYDGRSYRDDGRSYRDESRSYREDRSYRDGRPYRDDRSHRDDRSYRDDRSHRDDRSYRSDHRRTRGVDAYYDERSRSRHRSRHHGSRYSDHLEDHEGRLPVILMFDNGRGR